MRKVNINPECDQVNLQIIFCIKMDGKFTIKARLVADGHTTAPPLLITYSIFVSREGVSIEFLLAYLNDLEIFVCDNLTLNSERKF